MDFLSYNNDMNTTKVQELSLEHRRILNNLDKETLKLIVEDHSIAIEYAKKGVESVEPENVNREYIESVANEMQVLADMLLQERR